MSIACDLLVKFALKYKNREIINLIQMSIENINNSNSVLLCNVINLIDFANFCKEKVNECR